MHAMHASLQDEELNPTYGWVERSLVDQPSIAGLIICNAQVVYTTCAALKRKQKGTS